MQADEDEDPAKRAERERQALLARLQVAKTVSEDEFAHMLHVEDYFEDKIALLKTRGLERFQRGHCEQADGLFTRAIGMHACEGKPASHVLYSNRSACRCALGEYEGALADAEECIQQAPSWAKGYARLGAALHGLHRLDDAVRAYESGLKLDPTSAALSDGLRDALHRRRAQGGRWEVFVDGTAPELRGTTPDNRGTRHLVLTVGPRGGTECGQDQRSLLLCQDGMRLTGFDAESGKPCRAFDLACPSIISACCSVKGAYTALYIAEDAPTGGIVRRIPLAGTNASAPTSTDSAHACGHGDKGPLGGSMATHTVACSTLGISRPGALALHTPETVGGAQGDGDLAGSGENEASDARPTLYMCDSEHSRVLALDAWTFEVRHVIGRADASEDHGLLETPMALAVNASYLAIADVSACRVSLFNSNGGNAFLRHVGERASRFANVPHAGHFVRPPAHVALSERHLFVLEGGGTAHVHVFDPRSSAPITLILPPFNVVTRCPAREQGMPTPDNARWSCSAASGSAAERAALSGCLMGLCVGDKGLYVATVQEGRARILRLPRVDAAPAATPIPTAHSTTTAELMTEMPNTVGGALDYKRGFLLELS